MDKKLAIIIGVGPGLGLSLVKKFHNEGMKLCMIARNKDKLESYGTQLNKSEDIHSFQADAGDHKSLSDTLRRITEKHGTPDVLIYNVSLLRPAKPSDLNYDDFVEDFKINVGGMLSSHQVVFPLMRKKGKGLIVITGGGLSLKPYFEFASLGVGKAGLRNLAGSLAQEAINSGVSVYTITINGMIEPKTRFDPDLIADKFLDVYKNGLIPGEFEFVY